MSTRLSPFAAAVVLLITAPALPQAPPTTAPDPFAGAREVPITIHPHGALQHRIDYFRANDKTGERLYYDSGALASECPFKNGKPEGLRKQFYPSGELFCETPYHDGLIDGTVHFFAPDGSLLSHSTLKAGTGTLRQLPLAAQSLPDQQIPLRGGVVDGVLREYGRFFGVPGCNLTQYLNGSPEGWSITLNADSRLLESACLHNLRLHGVYRRFLPPGQPCRGFPKFYIDGKQVPEAAYREAAKTDPLLQKSLTDDGLGIARDIL